LKTKVFISYAGRDPQWPDAVVRELGLALETAGAEVWLDQFHLERQAEPGKLSAAEWREWMTNALQVAERVVCLASDRYELATHRCIDEAWGYGVAFESLSLIATLYQRKGRNNKWILTVRPDGAPITCVPIHMRDTCPEYQWPSERPIVLSHACKAPVSEMVPAEAHQPIQAAIARAAPLPEASSQPSQARDECKDTQARLQTQATIDWLAKPEAQSFWQALQKDFQAQPETSSWANASPKALVEGMVAAEPAVARKVMLAVRRVLKKLGGKPTNPQCRAAVALSMLCACRWVSRLPAAAPHQVVGVPSLRQHALAVLSASMFGGEVNLVADGRGGPRPQHLYDICPPAGDDAQTNLLAAIYTALFPDRMDATDIARKDSFTEAERKRLVADLSVRLEDIREVDGSSFTLIIPDRATWASADWSGALDVSPFVLDPELSQDLFAMDPDQLEAMVHELWRQMHASEGTAAAPPGAPPPPTTTHTPAMPTAPHISVNITGGNANVSLGDHSPINSQVHQAHTAVPLEAFLAELQSLKEEIAKLSSARASAKLAADAAIIEDAVVKKLPDGKSRITKALEALKNAGDAADGAEAVVDKIGKLTALAGPILTALF
jgi:hypothetical protein